MYCDLSGTHQGVAWTLLLNVGADSTFSYSNSQWDNALSSYPEPSEIPEINEKYARYDTMPLQQLRLDNLDSSATSILDFQPADKDKTLLELMQRSYSTRLTHTAGPPHPFELVTSLTVATCGTAWSINGKGGYPF